MKTLQQNEAGQTWAAVREALVAQGDPSATDCVDAAEEFINFDAFRDEADAWEHGEKLGDKMLREVDRIFLEEGR